MRALSADHGSSRAGIWRSDCRSRPGFARAHNYRHRAWSRTHGCRRHLHWRPGSMSEIHNLLRRAQPGANKTVIDHIARGERIADAIRDRWGLMTARAWKVKHLRWFLNEHCKPPMASTTRYDYWRTARALAAALGRWDDWEPH